jgi:cell division protein FtsL
MTRVGRLFIVLILLVVIVATYVGYEIWRSIDEERERLGQNRKKAEKAFERFQREKDSLSMIIKLRIKEKKETDSLESIKQNPLP